MLLLDKVTCLEDVRLAMLKLVSLKVCEMASQGQCENGFFLPKTRSKSAKCKECQIVHRRKKHNELRRERLLFKKQQNIEEKYKNLKQKVKKSDL